MIKSAALFAHQPLHIHVFTEEDMAPLFEGTNDFPILAYRIIYFRRIGELA